jgi:hypothetical protein
MRAARAAIEAYRDTLGLAPEGAQDVATELRTGSMPALAYEMLKGAGTPLHITDLLSAMGKESSRKNRTSLASSLSAYVRNSDVFTRPKPNTFGLMEWDGSVGTEASDDVEFDDDEDLGSSRGDVQF